MIKKLFLANQYKNDHSAIIIEQKLRTDKNLSQVKIIIIVIGKYFTKTPSKNLTENFQIQIFFVYIFVLKSIP